MLLDKESRQETEEAASRFDHAFEGFLDIPMQLRVELGRRRYPCPKVVALRVGSVVPLDRPAGENASLLLNGGRIGSGEIVVIEDSMGLRITEIRARDGGRGA